MPPEYTFVPWLRRGVAAEIATADTLGSNPDSGPTGRAKLPVELTLDTVPVGGGAPGPRPSVTRDVSILGPGDVGAIKAEAILRSYPADGSLGATPGELAFVEFYDEDFPWRYTPAGASGSRLRPWIALMVLTEDEFDIQLRHGTLPVVTLSPNVVLPPPTESWAWAHAQLSRIVVAPGDVDAAVRSSPDHSLARLLAPRRLLESRTYHAFVVPAFESGRLAGLGRRAALQSPVQKPAWGTPAHQNDRDYPVYYRFSFTTGTAGDFETLARKLVPAPVGDEFGKRNLDVADPGYGMTRRPGAVVELEAALAPPDLVRSAFPDSPGGPVTAEVEAIIDSAEVRRTSNVPDDPLVVPPAYGRWHAGVLRIADAAGDTDLAWLAELNLDLRNRAAAGLGGEVVRHRQEELVQRAWEQVGQVEQANQRLREAELARSAANSVLRKHIAQAGNSDRILVLTSAAHPGLSVPASGETRSIRGAVDLSRVPAAVQTPAFRRITRPQRPLMRRMTGARDLTEFQRGLLTEMNKVPEQALSTAPPLVDPAPSVALQSVRDAVAGSIAELQGKQETAGRVFMDLAHIELRARLMDTPPQDLDQLTEVTLRDSLTSRVDARFPTGSSPAQLALAGRVKVLINAITDVRADGPDAGTVIVAQAQFESEFGDQVAGKASGGLTVLGSAPAAGTPVAGVADLSDVQSFGTSLGAFDSGVVSSRTNPLPPEPLQAPAMLAAHVLDVLDPDRTIGNRLASALPVIAARMANDPRRLAPVMAHPQFRDPLFEWLRALSQDHIIPNVADLPRNSLTLMEPNQRFIESFLGGVNHSFAQELLWREYPTDQRGTYFKVFWDTRDALAVPDRDDITALNEWKGELGAQSPRAAGVLVLVIRGELLERYPSTVIYAQQAKWPGADTAKPRELDPAGEVRNPILHAKLRPDITIVGFDLDEDEARGHRPVGGDTTPARPGWFFVLMERPGEPRFGLDEATPTLGLRTWNDLAWDALTFPGGTPNIELAANAGLAPSASPPAVWGRTAADMAAILFQSPVLIARHASEMLP